jgi:hypothetical protein
MISNGSGRGNTRWRARSLTSRKCRVSSPLPKLPRRGDHLHPQRARKHPRVQAVLGVARLLRQCHRPLSHTTQGHACAGDGRASSGGAPEQRAQARRQFVAHIGCNLSRDLVGNWHAGHANRAEPSQHAVFQLARTARDISSRPQCRCAAS